MKISIVGVALIASAAANAADYEFPQSWGDQGDGTYANPILAGDYSDPEVIRAGEDYFYATSTFNMVPGVTILHSRDLVNWRAVGAAIPRPQEFGERFLPSNMKAYNYGMYAPSMRYRGGRFYVFVNGRTRGVAKAEGFLVAETDDPFKGEWKVHRLKDKNGKELDTAGWTDPCPIWCGETGEAFLASSTPARTNWYSYLFRMTPDATRLLDADVEDMRRTGEVFESGTLCFRQHSSEGNKLYHRNGYCYWIHIEFLEGGMGRGTYIYRAKNIYGDGGAPDKPGKYEILKFGKTIPGQGSLVDTPDGRWFWIGQFNSMDVHGRSPHLLPVEWVDDWPVIGVHRKGLVGEMAWRLEKPLNGEAPTLPQGSDDFAAGTLDPKWYWNHAPIEGKWNVGGGRLVMEAVNPLKEGDFAKIPNILCQRYLRSRKTEVAVTVDGSELGEGAYAGMMRLDGGKHAMFLGLRRNNGKLEVVKQVQGESNPVNLANPVKSAIRIIEITDASCMTQLFVEADGKRLFCGEYKLEFANYRSDHIGLCCFGTSGRATFTDFSYTADNKGKGKLHYSPNLRHAE